MKCPNCKGTNLRVPNTVKLNTHIIRYRICEDCGHRFKTWEVPVQLPQRKSPSPAPAPDA